MNRHGRPAVIITGGAVLILAPFLAWRWEDVYLEIYAWRTGWSFVWMPPNVIPGRRKSLNNAGQVAANWLGERGCNRAGLWSLADRTFRSIGERPGGGCCTNAIAINEVGSIVGDNFSDDLEANVFRNKAYFWTAWDGLLEIRDQGLLSMFPDDIDNNDTVVGTMNQSRPFSYRKGSSVKKLKIMGAYA